VQSQREKGQENTPENEAYPDDSREKEQCGRGPGEQQSNSEKDVYDPE
jgi:hypothetical protein